MNWARRLTLRIKYPNGQLQFVGSYGERGVAQLAKAQLLANCPEALRGAAIRVVTLPAQVNARAQAKAAARLRFTKTHAQA